MVWIEAQSTFVIGVLVFGFCYLLATVILCVALAQERALVAIEHALEARRNRVLLSQAEIAPVQWAVILVLATLILVTIALVHIDRRLAMGVTLFIFSTAVAICLVLLLVYDRPFGAGGFTVGPTVLRSIVPD